MKPEIVKTKINRIMFRHFLLPTKWVRPETSLGKDLGFNHWETMEMMLHLEHEFRIDLNDDDIEHIKTVGDAIACVERYLVRQVA